MSIIFIICICMKHTRALCTLANSSNKYGIMSRRSKWMGENTYIHTYIYYLLSKTQTLKWNEMKHTRTIEIRISYNCVVVVGVFFLCRGGKKSSVWSHFDHTRKKEEECWNKSFICVMRLTLSFVLIVFLLLLLLVPLPPLLLLLLLFCLYPTLFISRCVFCVSPVLCASLTFPFKYLAAIEMVAVWVCVTFRFFNFGLCLLFSWTCNKLKIISTTSFAVLTSVSMIKHTYLQVAVVSSSLNDPFEYMRNWQ